MRKHKFLPDFGKKYEIDDILGFYDDNIVVFMVENKNMRVTVKESDGICHGGYKIGVFYDDNTIAYLLRMTNKRAKKTVRITKEILNNGGMIVYAITYTTTFKVFSERFLEKFRDEGSDKF